MKKLSRETIHYHLPAVLGVLLLIMLIFLPTGFEDAVIYQGTDRAIGKVVEVDNSMIVDAGILRSGEQTCTIQLSGGKFDGQRVEGYNMLTGSLELDKIFQVGDEALVVIDYQDDKVLSVNMIDHYRIDKEMILLALFAILLIVFAGQTGARALLAFAITILLIWKVLVPAYLNGYDPIVAGLLLTAVLITITSTLVYGFDARSLSVIIGCFFALLVTCVLGAIFTDQFMLHGAIMNSSESLLYSGYLHLDLTKIFIASIFIGSSGAVMDLAVDITSAVHEVLEKKPDLSWQEAAISGMNVGRAALGTMTTTLLLAYSGGYIALLMVFMAQGTPIDNILNYKYISAEILDTIVGSCGLVTVAPLTALTSGWFLTRKNRSTHQ